MLYEVITELDYDGTKFFGFGAHTDIITASVEAFLDAVNKIPVQ